MKCRALLLALICTTAVAEEGDFYRWTDADGELHYTDDLSSIPEQFRKKAEKTRGEEIGEVTTQKPPPEARPEGDWSEPPPPPKKRPARDAGGPTAEELREARWRKRFRELREEISMREERVAANRKRLSTGELAPRLSNTGEIIRNPEALRLAEQIGEDNTRVAELQERLKQLERDASNDAVPLEWRR